MTAIVRKFTNYRNTRKKQLDDRVVELEAIKNAAAALTELKAYSNGRDVFRQEKHSEITERKKELMHTGEVTSGVGAYQRAVRELWEEEDQDYWEEKAAEYGKDVSK